MFGNCLRCGRALSNKYSVRRGYGTSCYKKVEAEKKKKDADENLKILEKHLEETEVWATN